MILVRNRMVRRYYVHTKNEQYEVYSKSMQVLKKKVSRLQLLEHKALGELGKLAIISLKFKIKEQCNEWSTEMA